MSECSQCGYSGCIECGDEVDFRVFRCDPCLANHLQQFPTTTPAEREKTEDILASFVAMGKEVGMVEQPFHEVEQKIVSKLHYYRIYDALIQAPDAQGRIEEVVKLIDDEARKVADKLIAELAKEDGQPCYLCAVPGRDERARTSMCDACGRRLKADAEQLLAALEPLRNDICEAGEIDTQWETVAKAMGWELPETEIEEHCRKGIETVHDALAPTHAREAMVEFKDTNTFTLGNQTFHPVMMPKGVQTKMQHVIDFKNALRRAGQDPNDGALFYCEKDATYGMVFLPGEKHA